MKWFDKFFEQTTRDAARTISRRNAIVRVGKLLVGSAFVLPVLPFDRVALAGESARPNKKAALGDTDCDYWRYCALDGFLCTCCGGSVSSCPAGTEPSKVSWIGTCHSHKDGKDYLITYNDCCGVTPCGRCLCNGNEGERPGYRMGVHNDINWCMGNSSNMYHCTVAAIVGVGDKGNG